MNISIAENKQSLTWFLQGFYNRLEWSLKENPNTSPGVVIEAYLKDEIDMEKAMKEYAAMEHECYLRNMRILRAIKTVKGKTFYKYLLEIIEESEGIRGMAEIMANPTGKFQEENYGKQIKGIWVEQWSVGLEGDSYEGIICVEIKPNKYFKFNFSM